MLSRSSVYALQAVLHLARQEPGTSVSAARMAGGLAVPPKYLAKVLHRLSREGLLASRRGAHGGYRLVAAPQGLTVEQVVAPFEDVEAPKVCLLGGPCHSERPCAAHIRRLEWRDARRRILAETTLADLLDDPAPRAGMPDTELDSPLMNTGS